MRLFSEVEVRGDGVLHQVHYAVAEQNQNRSDGAGQPEALGNHLQYGCGQHEARTEGNGVAKRALSPLGLNQNKSAKNIGQRGGGTENERKNQGSTSMTEAEEQIIACALRS